jgi:hypothetical protein
MYDLTEKQTGSEHYLVKAKIILPYNMHTQRIDRNHKKETEKVCEKEYSIESFINDNTKHLGYIKGVCMIS